MTRQPDLSLVSRRRVLQSIGSAGVAGLAGCLGGNRGSDPEGSDTPDDIEEESTPESTEAEDGQDYSLPESAHRTPGQMASDWGTVFRHDETEYVDAFSPSQVAEVQGESWMDVWGGDDEFYSMFDFHSRHVPETIIQYTGDHSIKVDQLPGGVEHEDVKSSLQDAGYQQAGTVGGFDLMVNREDGRARAVGDGYHVLSIYEPRDGELGQKRSDVENVVEAYNSDEGQLQSDMQDMLGRLEVRDTFGSEVQEEGEYINGVSDSDLEPLGGAVTVDLEEGVKRGI